MSVLGCQFESCCSIADEEISITIRRERGKQVELVALCTQHRREYRSVVKSRSASQFVRVVTRDLKSILQLDGAGGFSIEQIQSH